MLKHLPAFLLFPILLAACTQNNVTEDSSLKKYFDDAHVTGSFGLFDNGQGHFTIYNLSRFRDSAFQPAQTFDIILSLIGVQTGVVKDDSTVIRKDSPDTDKWEESPMLRTAFQTSFDPAFRTLARQIGKDTLKHWVDSLGYGNKNTGGGANAGNANPESIAAASSFWMDNRLKITSDEQLGLVKKLYFDQLPFYQRTQKIVRGMFNAEKNANYQLIYKAGQGKRENGHLTSWIIGWIEENKHPYFFVLNLDAAGPEGASPELQLTVLKPILKQLGFFNGQK